MGDRMCIVRTARLQLVGESQEGRGAGGDLGRRIRLRVVLAKRKGYYVLKTAFYGIKPHRRHQFEAERKAFWGT